MVLEAALTQLEALDPRCGQVMHLTFFAGLTREEIATLLKISVTTVRRDLSFGRTWLAEALGSET